MASILICLKHKPNLDLLEFSQISFHVIHSQIVQRLSENMLFDFQHRPQPRVRHAFLIQMSSKFSYSLWRLIQEVSLDLQLNLHNFISGQGLLICLL